MNFTELAKRLPGATATQALVFEHISTDTRAIQPAAVFVALRGANFDGHKYAGEAVHKGAVGLVVEKIMPELSVPQLVVKDTALALGDIAALYRQNFSGKVISITGSCGKTTVKSMLLAICQGAAKTSATQGNKNNHIGVPLSVLSLEGDERFAIIEAGTSGPGEIAYLGKIIQPDVALVNNIGSAHLEGLGTVANIAEEKADLYRSLKNSGVAIINLDDHFAEKFIELNHAQQRLGFGFNHQACRRAEAIFDCVSGEVLKQQVIRISYRGDSVDIQLPIPGYVNCLNALAAAACAVAAGLSLQEVKQGLEGFSSVAGRMQPLPTKVAKLLVDDTYNANPSSVKAAIDYLAAYEKSVFILGDMGELGELTEQAHTDIGMYAAQKNIGVLLAVGRYSELAVKSFGKRGEWYPSQRELIDALRKRDLQENSILVKGSRGSKMENVVQAILTIGEKHNAGLAG